MESLFDAWGKKNPEWEKKYEELLIEPFADYRRGTSQYTVSRGKIFGAGYEMFIIGFFIGLYFDKTRKLPDDRSKRKHFGHPIMFWGSQDGKSKLGRTSYKKIQDYMFAALVARTDIDFISLEKGETSVNDAANSLISKMEEYANYGFHYLKDMLDNDPNSLFKDSAFLKIFTSFTSEDNKEEEEVENFEEDIEPLNDEELEDDAIDEETMRAEAEKPWSESDLDKLAAYYENGAGVEKIAERLGKSVYSVQFQLAQRGYIRMPLNVTVRNTDAGGVIINRSGDIVYSDEAVLKIFNNRIYRFNRKPKCLTIKAIERVNGEWRKGKSILVIYSDSPLFSVLSPYTPTDDIEDIVEGETREKNQIKVSGKWYDCYGDPLNSKPSALDELFARAITKEELSDFSSSKKTWSALEKKELKELYRLNMGVKMLANYFNTSVGDIKEMIRILKL